MIRIYSHVELVAALVAQFPAAASPSVMNEKYCATTKEWVQETFATYVWNVEVARGQLKYKKRGNQCEHYSLRAALEVIDLFSQMPEEAVPAEAESLAIACCMYRRTDNQKLHEVNLWYIGGVWLPWEPQTRTFFDFTEEERLSVKQAIIL